MFTKKVTTNRLLMAAAVFLTASTALAQGHRAIKGNVHPNARPEFDEGAVDGGMKMGSMSLTLKRSAAQQAALNQLLSDQQNRHSAQFHQWLTPEQFADRFGASKDNNTKLASWLQSNGFTVSQVSRGRDYIAFTGTAGQVESSLKTQIHHYKVNGETHYANAEEPSLPSELAGLVAGIHGLNDFKPKSPKHNRYPAIGLAGKAPSPDFYSSYYPGVNVMAPGDLATIYNVTSLYSQGIDGTGQTIAVAGITDIEMSDIEYFRAAFGLPFNDPRKVFVPGAIYPGINEALGEADLDLEWSGAIAKNATVYYVYSDDPLTSAAYAIDQAIAPVLTYSFGQCELSLTEGDVAAFANTADKAAAEGITWVASAGDSGAAGCENQNGTPTSATTPASVDMPAAIPTVTAVGGSEFREGNGTYWAGRLSTNAASAMGYIPEGSWTDEAYILETSRNGFASSGGGASLYFQKPAWQNAPGVPNDGARDVPDVALTASWFHDPYTLISGGQFLPNGGTSAAAPSFAGMLVLINQYLVASGAQKYSGLGNANAMLYSLAQNAPSAFHDIATGSNAVPCVTGSSRDCTNGYYGYAAGVGYDQVTGLGSVDAYYLALAWANAEQLPRLVVTQLTASASAKVGGAFSMNFAVANQGQAAAGAFEMRLYFTTNGDVSSAPYYVYCDVKNLAANASIDCSGTVTLGPSVTAGNYLLVGVADATNAVAQSDRSGDMAMASTGVLTVSR
jgi:subtilase family serine protease